MLSAESVEDAAMEFCWYEKCPDVVGVTDVLIMIANQYLQIENSPDRAVHNLISPRLVVSLTSLPARLEHLTQTLTYFLGQTKLPDKIYVNLPAYSEREGRAYSIPDNLQQYIER